ncbi:hypothetical protein CCACVL1_17119 [Corchorus capsularis]|uniref:F-box domain-containing protein n=1 Tax=Corchorus capsularis TaxID=210143 RepID=A0A1R3HU37_COCAP|nr:hypothetical protein CCACVL1_17119 [Corchorus capsularis]
MKLRVRNYETRETLKIQVPSPSSFFQLQGTLSLTLPAPHPSPSSLRFSLNAKDLLQAPSPDATLQSLGVAPGDLIYFSLNPSAFSLSPPIQDPMVEESNQLQPESSTNQDTQVLQSSTNQDTQVLQSSQLQEPMSKEPQFSLEAEEIEEAESMDIDALAVSERWSEPYFLRKVLKEGLGDDRNMHNLMAIAVHAVLLESGFVGFDPVSKLQIDRFHLPDEWPSPVPICYSLPELLRHGSNLTDYVVLKFQTLGHFFQGYGCLVGGGSGLHRLSLDEHRFAPTLDLVWSNCDVNDTRNRDGTFKSYSENVVFEFWKIVKDRLGLPLLIDLCDRTGLALPACLMRLPIELKLRIVESLPGADIARMECVCKEMRNLASNNDLWMRKCEEEFPNWKGTSAKMIHWKSVYQRCWENRKKRKIVCRRWRGPSRFFDPVPFPVPHLPYGLPPFTIGGDYDLLPGHVGDPSANVRHVRLVPGPIPRHQLVAGRLRCNFGERQNDA